MTLTLTNIYLFCLVLGFVFTVGGALLGQFLGSGDSDGSGHDGLGSGHAVGHGDLDAGHAGSHGDLDSGHADADATDVGQVHLPLLSPTVLSSFAASFGGAGLIYQRVFGEANAWLHLPLAGATAAGLGVGMAWTLWKITHTFESNRVARASDALGAQAEVSVSVPEGGVGEVAYVSGGARQTLTARSSDGQAHKQGSTVCILRIAQGVAFVSASPRGMQSAVTPVSDAAAPPAGEPIRRPEHK